VKNHILIKSSKKLKDNIKGLENNLEKFQEFYSANY